MSDIDHEEYVDAGKHDVIIVDPDKHFTINTTNRAISPDPEYKKLTLMQYDNKSERYSFDIDRIIDGHDLINCDRVQIHFINIGSNKQKHPGLYLVDDVHVNEDDKNKISFTWLISQDATQLSGILSFLISFECTDGETILYRWSSSIYNSIQITAGMDNDNTIVELYADELLAWEHQMATEVIPDLVDQNYVNREFATSEEVAEIFGMSTDNLPEVLMGQYIVDATVENDVLTLSKSDGSTLEFEGGGNDDVSIVVDDALNTTSTNPVQNKVVAEAINELNNKPTITVDSVLSDTSENPVQNKVVAEAINELNNKPTITVDSVLSDTSENPVQNKVIVAELNSIKSGSSITADSSPTENSENLVRSGGVKTYVDNAIQTAITSALGGSY